MVTNNPDDRDNAIELMKAWKNNLLIKNCVLIMFCKKFIEMKKIGEKKNKENIAIIKKSINEINLFLLNKYSKLSVWIS